MLCIFFDEFREFQLLLTSQTQCWCPPHSILFMLFCWEIEIFKWKTKWSKAKKIRYSLNEQQRVSTRFFEDGTCHTTRYIRCLSYDIVQHAIPSKYSRFWSIKVLLSIVWFDCTKITRCMLYVSLDLAVWKRRTVDNEICWYLKLCSKMHSATLKRARSVSSQHLHKTTKSKSHHVRSIGVRNFSEWLKRWHRRPAPKRIHFKWITHIFSRRKRRLRVLRFHRFIAAVVFFTFMHLYIPLNVEEKKIGEKIWRKNLSSD